MRGHRLLKVTGQLDAVARVKEALKTRRLDADLMSVSPLIFGAAMPEAELVVRQYLVVRRGDIELGERLLRSLLKSQNSLTFGLPRQWRQAVTEQGFPISPFRSMLAWQAYVFALFSFGVALFAKRILSGLVELAKRKPSRMGRFIYFDGLIPNALPQKTADGISHDVISWYHDWSGSTGELDAFCHGVKGASRGAVGGIPVFPINSPVGHLDEPKALFKFFLWGMRAIAQTLVDLARGRWAHAVMFGEAVKAAQIRCQSPTQLAQTYLFNNSSCVYRPLWSYEAERLGSKVSLYFYSANCEPFKRPYGYAKFSNFYYELMNWPNYIVWDEYQAEFIRRAAPYAGKIDCAGTIWFSTGNKPLPIIPAITVAVFDVQPVRNSFYQRLGIEFDYYIPANANAFLADCYAAIQGCNASMALKRKREIGSLVHPAYQHFVDKLALMPGFVSIDASASASQLIEKCEVVISMPFTSTAITGRAQGKPSVYYDPLGMIQKDDRGAHGIPILRGVEELRSWLMAVLPGGRTIDEHRASAAPVSEEK